MRQTAPISGPVPRSFASCANALRGEPVVVCGCGSSLIGLGDTWGDVTIVREDTRPGLIQNRRRGET